jgi:GTP-binding protein
VLQAVYDLFIDLGGDEEMLDCPVLWAVAREGRASRTLGDPGTDLRPMLDAVLAWVPPPPPPSGQTARLLVTNLDYDPYVGRLGIGRLFGAPLRRAASAVWFGAKVQRNVRVQTLFTWRGLRRHEVEVAQPGDVVAIAGVEDLTVGDTVASGPEPAALPRVRVDEPTIGLTVTVNSSPLAGRDGRQLTGRQIRERLEREVLSNVSLRLEEGEGPDTLRIWGRGELQLGILVETMRREGFELSVSRPQVVFREVGGEMHEPYEQLSIDVPDVYVGAVTQNLAGRRGELVDLVADGAGRTRTTWRVPSRGLIGFRGEMLTETRGEGVLNTLFDGWGPHAGTIQRRPNGALVADRSGRTTAYALFHLQPRGVMFVGEGEDVYEGMIIGENARNNDINVNVVRAKQLTNFRSAGADEKLLLTPPRRMTLEAAMEFIDDDEWVEVTPVAIRLRKRVLPANQRSVIRGEGEGGD